MGCTLFYQTDFHTADALDVVQRGNLYFRVDRVEMNILVCSLMLLFCVDLLRNRSEMRLDEFLLAQNTWFRWTFMMGLIVMIFVFGKYGPSFDAQQFIYFQF